MHHKKTFFDEDISIKESLFDNFKIDNIASWSHLELWCSIQNIDIDYEFFKGILCGTIVFNNLFDIILDAIKNTDFIDKFIDEIQTIEIIEKLFNNFNISRTFKAKEFWIDIAYKQNYEDEYINHFNTGINEDIKKKYHLLNAIFKKNPFILVKFYDKFKSTIHQYDIDFEIWLLKSFHTIADDSELHREIFNALKLEIQKQSKYAMFLN